MFHVGDGFVERVEISLLAGQTLEQQYTCTKIDNSVDDPVCGHVTDIIYEVAMPVIVKREVRESEDDDCEILSFQPAPHGFVLKMKIKEEKLEPKQEGWPETRWKPTGTRTRGRRFWHRKSRQARKSRQWRHGRRHQNWHCKHDAKKKKIEEKSSWCHWRHWAQKKSAFAWQDKTRQDCLSYYLFVKKKNKLFLVFWVM